MEQQKRLEQEDLCMEVEVFLQIPWEEDQLVPSEEEAALATPSEGGPGGFEASALYGALYLYLPGSAGLAESALYGALYFGGDAGLAESALYGALYFGGGAGLALRMLVKSL